LILASGETFTFHVARITYIAARPLWGLTLAQKSALQPEARPQSTITCKQALRYELAKATSEDDAPSGGWDAEVIALLDQKDLEKAA
jgi:hypothetical protein